MEMIAIKITDVRAVPGDSGFLIDDGKTAVLCDSGFAFTGYQVADNIKKMLGRRPLNYILLTHSHYDHVLGTPYILKEYPNAKVIAGVYADQIFRKPTARAVMRELDGKAAKKHGVLSYEDLIDNLKIDGTVEDGDTIACGDMHFMAVALPGHTKCSVGYYLVENKLLLSVETLGVYLGDQTYLPSFLVGYQMTLESIRKAGQMEVETILLPHYGVVEGEEMRAYLENAEVVTKEAAHTIAAMFRAGKTKEEILAFFTERDYKDHVKPIYPIDAFLLNTGIMIQRAEKELGANQEAR